MNTIGLGSQIINFQEQYEYDIIKWKTKKINFDRKLTYESTDSWFVLDENNNKVRKSDTKPFTIYITTQEIDINIQFGNDDHILTYWGNNKEKIDSLLKEQIDDDNIIGKKELVLIGDFKQNMEVLYAQYNSKYKPFRDEFPKQSELKQIKKLIDIQKSFRLEFALADIVGEQYKVLNDRNSIIIDGSAGTGKSTIALQKLKYLELNEKVLQEKMLVIVKNKQVISHFKTLLEDKELLLNNVHIKEVSNFLNNAYPNLKNITKNYLIEIREYALQVKKDIDKSIQELSLKNLTNHLIVLFNNIDTELLIKSLTNIIDGNRRLNEKIIKDIFLIKNEIKVENNIFNKKLEKIKWSIFSSIDWKVSKYSFYYTDNLYNLTNLKTNNFNIPFSYHKNYLLSNKERKIEIIKEKLDVLKYKKEINEQKDKRYKKALNSLNSSDVMTLSIEILKEISDISNNEKLKALYWIKKYILDFKNLEKDNDNILEERLYKSFKKNKNEIDKFKNILQKIYFTEQFILDNYFMNFSSIEKFLMLNYIFSKREKALNTIIVDEAQDYTLVELELLRFQANRIILTGDILQNIGNNEIKEWSDILNINDVYQVEDKNGEEKLNIFTLKHNYRQTYQLANASYNLRQLLLDSKLEDIEKEYWVSEKEFNGKPYQLPKILFKQNIKKYIKEKIKHIKNTFTAQIPIVLIYKTEKEHKEYKEALLNLKISENTEEIKGIDVILISILEAKGKQFPVVVSRLDGLTDREIYLIMTRGEFEVDFLSSQQKVDNLYLKELYDKDWIEVQHIQFILKKSSIKPNNGDKSLKDEVNHQIDNKNDKTSKEKVAFNPNQDNSSKEEENPKSKNKKQKNNDNKSSSESIQNDLLEAKAKHQGEIKEIEKELTPIIIQDIEEYIKKAQKEYEKTLKNVPIKTTKHIVTRNVKIGRKETKWFLENEYKGFCQICGFTFTKRNSRARYFELFDWFSEKITGQKVKVVQAGSSLCLCARCHSGIKYGAYKESLVEILKDLDISKLSFDDFVKKISVSVENKDIPKCYDFIEMDMYKVAIELFGKEQFIFYTEGHFLHLYSMLSLKKKER